MVRRGDNLNRGLILVVLLFAIYLIITGYFGKIFILGSVGLITYLVLAVIVIAVFMRPIIGLMLLVILLPYKIKFIPYVSVMEAVGWVTIVSWLIGSVVRRELKFSFGKPELLISVLFLISCFSLFVNPSFSSYNIGYLVSFIAVALLYVLTILMLDNREKIYLILLMLILGSAISCLYGMYNYFIEGAGRISGFSKKESTLAYMLLLCIPYLILQVVYSRNTKVKMLHFFLTVLFAAGLAFTGTRNRIIAAPLILGILTLIDPRKKGLLLILGLFILISVLLFYLLPTEKVTERMSALDQIGKPEEAEDDSIHSRWESVILGLKVISKHPIVGVGSGTAVIMDSDSRHGRILHNAYLQLGAESGIPAVIIYVFLFVSILRQQWHLRKFALRTGDDLFYILSTTFFMGIITIMIGNLFISTILDKTYLLWLGLAVALYRVESKDKMEAADG